MNKRFRLVLVLLLVAVCAVFLYPTIKWYFYTSDEDQEMAASTPDMIREQARTQARVSLDDLRGIVSDDPDATVPEEYAFLETVARTNYQMLERPVPRQWTVAELLGAFTDEGEVFDELESHYAQAVMDLKSLRDRIITLGLDLYGGLSAVLEADRASLTERLGREPTAEELDDAITLAITILTSRIDQFGVTEPVIRRLEGTNRILVEVPGESDRSRVESYIQGKGSLGFYLVDDEATSQLLQLQSQDPTWDPDFDGIPDFIPVGTTVAPYVLPDQYGILRLQRYIAIKEDIDQFGVSGDHITEAEVGSTSLTREPTVNFVLDPEGTQIFANLTRDNVGGSLAIVLDGRVRTYARINSEIGTGQVQIEGLDAEQAQNISIVLRTAALPVELKIVSLNSVGASLGADAVQAGLRAIALGFALVVVFMLFYYLGAGVIADLALIMNLFIIVSILSVFNLTLTLTSIAGLILTVGMAVDANVIIFERIKEEYRLGKGRQAAVKAGFQKAFTTVMDANITTFIAALFLSMLGTSAVRGFAVTLAVGIVSSMITALFVSRLVFDFGTEALKRSKLSLGWGVR
jgi:preprotein translocase subunit SecD